METIVSRIRFDKSGYYFIGLLLLAFLGFWKSYFYKFFIGKNDFSFYYHFHASMMIIWVTLLITQPLLIRYKRVHLHRMVGQSTYFIMPLLILSVLFVLNSGMKNIPANELSFNRIIFPFRDIILLIASYSIGIFYRQNTSIHSRAMITTGIVFIEPALFRFLDGVIFKNMESIGFYVGAASILTLIAFLIFIERNQKSGRWIFPFLLAIYIIVYCIGIFQIPLNFLDPLARWFAALALSS